MNRVPALWKRKMRSLTGRLRKGEKRRDCSGAPLRRGTKKVSRAFVAGKK